MLEGAKCYRMRERMREGERERRKDEQFCLMSGG